MPKVWNKRDKNTPPDAVYIGRGSKWGNMFSHLPNSAAKYHVSTREEAIEQYELWFCYSQDAEPLRKSLYELEGKDLVCFCAPLPCHGDFLLRIANYPDEDIW